MFLYQKKYIFLLLLAGIGLSNAATAQKIVIHEADSSWMGSEIPANALAEKKFTFNRRWYQNLVTRFNYYFNADQTMQHVLEQAEDIHEDNYDSTLTFYPYDAADFRVLKSSLDSVILTAGIGIEVHDPRSKWMDDLYLLVGTAYYYQQNDSEAIAAFKYMIKNLGEKDDMGNPALVGSRAYQSESNISIVTPEERNRSHPPARNDAFIWLIRASLDSGLYDQATSLISALKEDPQLPARLQTPLLAIQTQYHLAKGQMDSAQTTLKSAIALQQDKKLQARWQFILSQLYEQQKQWDRAVAAYREVDNYRPPPLMRFYARLNQTRIRVLQNPAQFSISSKPLLEMARRERYARYRSIIYYNLGKLALQTGHPEQGIAFLEKSLRYNPDRKKVHFSSFAMLADYFYNHRQYRPAKKYYDSAAAAVSTPDPKIALRKDALTGIVKNLDIIVREDSLQRLARMPHDSLMAFLNEIVADSMRDRRKRNRILKGDNKNESGLFSRKPKNKEPENEKEDAGSWYFYNNVAKGKGFSEFRAEWGNRPLADNWRLSNPNRPVSTVAGNAKPLLATDSGETGETGQSELLLQKLLDPLPLTPEAIAKSDENKMKSRHENINIFFLQLDDDTATLTAIDTLLRMHPDNPYLADIYYKLYLIYSRIPDMAKAGYYKQLLLSGFADSEYAKVFGAEKQEATEKALADNIAHLYDQAYLGYLTGAYDHVAALEDSALYLDPENEQKARFSLLHAMTILKTRSDSAGQAALKQVIANNATDTPIISQAKLILNELQHKNELVEHLLNLQLPEEQPDSAMKLPEENAPDLPRIQAIAADRTLQTGEQRALQSPSRVGKASRPGMDSLQSAALRAQTVRQLSVNKAMHTDKQDSLSLPVQAGKLNRPAMDSTRLAALRAQAVKTMQPGINEVKTGPDSIAVADSIKKSIAAPVTPYKIERDIPYFVVLSFKKTDGDLIAQTLKAFATYNGKHHTADSIEVSSYVLARNQVILIFRLFKGESDALLYYKEISQKTSTEIIPNLRTAYYRLFFISRSNFILLNNTQDFEGYLNFFYKHYK